MTRLIPSDDELHAYVDERLEPVRRAEVQAWLAANPQEVADVFEVPLAHLMDPANHRRHAVQWRGVTREWFSMPYDTEHRQRLIWGATAAILHQLAEQIQAP